jgi:hypothetical protein
LQGPGPLLASPWFRRWMVPNASERCKIELQLESFKDAKGLFGIEVAKTTRDKKKLKLNGGILMGMNVQNYKGLQFEF